MTRRHNRAFVRTFFTSPTAVEGDNSAKMLERAAELRGIEAPDVWVPDNEDATAPGMREEGIANIIDVVATHGAEVPAEIHPRVVWHRDDPATRAEGFEQIRQIATSEAASNIDGFVIPEVGGLDDWKKADEVITLAESKAGLPTGTFAMSVIVESATAELALADLREAIHEPSNGLERLFLLVDGEVDYTKDMRAITPTGALPDWPELRHNTARGASAADLIAVDGPYDDIRDIEGYRERMVDNQARGQLGIWALTPNQVVTANKAPLPPETGEWLFEIDDEQVSLSLDDDSETYVYEGERVSITDIEDGYRLQIDGQTRRVDAAGLRAAITERAAYVPSLADIVDSMEEFEAAKAAGRGAISMERAAVVEIGGVTVEISKDRMWDEATYQAATTPIDLFQDVYKGRPDQREALEERYGADVVERATQVG
jgi:Citrate lyase beta subunit